MPTSDDLAPLLEAVLARAGVPVTVAAITKALPAGKKLPKADVELVLGKLVATGRIHRWPARVAKFSTLSPEAFAREEILRAVASGPLTEVEIKRQVAAAARPLVKSALASLVRESTLAKHPKLGGKVPFGLGPPDAADYLPAELETAFKRLIKVGFKDADLQLALRRYVGVATDQNVTADGPQEILTAMTRLNSQVSRGALLYLNDLRAALTKQFRDKESFDSAVMRLAEEGKVQLQTHAWPGRLSDNDKHALIPNGLGGFFDTIGIRLE
ncbi:MAG: hypothetical protein ABI612_08165 [Betaproteobacteria bacterium]